MVGGRTTEPERLYGRIVEPDPRDSRYRAGALLPDQWPKYRRRSWTIGPILDQGLGRALNPPRVNSCVGHGVKAWMMATPTRSTPDAPPSAFDLYDLSRMLDGDPSNDHADVGTSVRGGLKAAQAGGRVKSYVWSTTVDETAHWLLRYGGAIIGIPWLSGMDETDGAGYVRASGRLMGGHCVFLFGVDRDTETFLGQQSWGALWGGWQGKNGGCFKLRFDDLDGLMRQDGEVALPVERPIQRSGTP